ncbi:MAG: hypothetical protein GY805_21470, partial [Chloroflexi bacterium]|nr:hypothetical protein [Chloroflexota bacterium]
MRPVTAVTLNIFLLLLLGFALVNGGIVLLAFPFLLYLMFSLLDKPEAATLHISRTLSATRIPAESEVVVTLTVSNDGPSLGELLLIDNLPPKLTVIDGKTRWLLALPSGD